MSDTTQKNLPGDTKDLKFSRREMLLGLSAATAAVYSGSALSEMKDHSHHQHDHSKHSPQQPQLLDAVNNCVDKEQRCLAHCLVAFQEGDTTLAECAAKVNEAHAICEAFAYLLTANSSYIKAYAKLCETACRDCEKECRKHEDTHRECKACADACADVVDQIKLQLS